MAARRADRIVPDAVDVLAPTLRGPVLMHQDWRDLAYAHWAVEPERVAHLFPAGVFPDVFEGSTYVGLVPFRMCNAGFGRRIRVPWFGDFLETNIRLYSVDHTGRRGVVFLSLDCDRLAVVAGARAGFAVPYRWARMEHACSPGPDGLVHRYRSRVRTRSAPDVEMAVRVGESMEGSPLDHFLSARWGLHTSVLGTTYFVPNAHPTWPLHRAEVVDLRGSLLAEAGFADLLGRAPDQVAFSPGVHTRFGFPFRI
ncbi:MAG: YqjF family protein [Sporichthyaceae bacterium]